MGKKNKSNLTLGKSLMKDKSGKRIHYKNSMRHTSEIHDGQDYNRINFNSITEQTDVESFLATAELAGTDFKADKQNIKVINTSATIGVLSKEERNKIEDIQHRNKNLLRIPRRPPWNRSMSAEELADAERETFLEWRRGLARLQEQDGILLTPYEKNIEFWRQLWRVIERSDVVVQIVDARNPLLFRCDDLTQYVKEVDPLKENLLLVNKSDFLTETQRQNWADYFQKEGINAVFFSATCEDSLDAVEEEPLLETEIESAGNQMKEPSSDDKESEDEELLKLTETEVAEIPDEKDNHSYDQDDDDDDDMSFYTPPQSPILDLHVKEMNLNDSINTNSDLSSNLSHQIKECKNDINHLSQMQNTSENKQQQITSQESVIDLPHMNYYSKYINSPKLLSRSDLIEVFRSYCNGSKLNPSHVTIGLVGYPNVGKSSTINSLLQEKKVSVSATPGKTKHFQTLFLSSDIVLCDCPGLVFPGFVTTKEEMIISGILPIDQMRDHIPPMNLLLSLIPRYVLEAKYGVKIPLPKEGEDPNRNPTSEEFLKVYGQMRGYMSHKGMPDHPRSARYILKDYINGKLLYCHCPPGEDQEDFHHFIVDKVHKLAPVEDPHQEPLLDRRNAEQIDEMFFNESYSGVHVLGRKFNHHTLGNSATVNSQKPWRVRPKREVKQKLRKKFAHLDKHD